MSIKTTLKAIALAAAMPVAMTASGYSIKEAYAKNDIQYIVTNSFSYGSIYKVVKQKDYAKLSDAFFDVGKPHYAIGFACNANDPDRVIKSLNAMKTNDFISATTKLYISGAWESWLWKKAPEKLDAEPELVDALHAMYASCAADPKKAENSNLESYPYAIWMYNIKHPDNKFNVKFTDEAIQAYASGNAVDLACYPFNYGKDKLDESNHANMIVINREWKRSVTLFVFAMRADAVNKPRKQTTFRKIAMKRIKSCNLKARLAIQLNSPDDLLDALANITPKSFNAKELNLVVKMLNAQPVTWRKDEVLTALRNINSMYTLNLYEDRDTWEPIISKVRAMLDVR